LKTRRGKLPPVKAGGFMPSSLLELRQGLVYAAHSPEDFASEPSSLESLIARNLLAKLNTISQKRIFKYITILTLITDRQSPCGGGYEGCPQLMI